MTDMSLARISLSLKPSTRLKVLERELCRGLFG